jgi:molecular chaperone HscB
MNYFEVFNLPLSLRIDKGYLKKEFYRLSREYHPDHFAQAEIAEKEKALEMSALLNKAYQVLQDPDETLTYVLKLKGLYNEEEKGTMPQSFLMEMMELNEQLMELEMEPDADALENYRKEVLTRMEDLRGDVSREMSDAGENSPPEVWQELKNYLMKKKYLGRIMERLRNIAAPK